MAQAEILTTDYLKNKIGICYFFEKSTMFGWPSLLTTTIHIGVTIDRKVHTYDYSAIPIHEWSTVEISQSKFSDQKYIKKISINGVEQTVAIHSLVDDYDNVLVYNADPWYSPAAALTRNLEIHS